MSSPSEDERDGDSNLTPNGDADQDLNDEMDDLFDEDVDDEAEAKAYVKTFSCFLRYSCANLIPDSDGNSMMRS
jgi:hypothetical protein